jgi:formate dehydrogenase beta subunit
LPGGLPQPGAIIKHANGIVDFNQDHCIGCGYCITGCPFNIPRISQKDHKAYKCTLCSDRVAVGLEPACVKTCPTGAIVFGTKEDMKEHAAERIVDLKVAALTTPVCTTRRRRRHPRDVRAAPCRHAEALRRTAG